MTEVKVSKYLAALLLLGALTWQCPTAQAFDSTPVSLLDFTYSLTYGQMLYAYTSQITGTASGPAINLLPQLDPNSQYLRFTSDYLNGNIDKNITNKLVTQYKTEGYSNYLTPLDYVYLKLISTPKKDSAGKYLVNISDLSTVMEGINYNGKSLLATNLIYQWGASIKSLPIDANHIMNNFNGTSTLLAMTGANRNQNNTVYVPISYGADCGGLVSFLLRSIGYPNVPLLGATNIANKSTLSPLNPDSAQLVEPGDILYGNYSYKVPTATPKVQSTTAGEINITSGGTITIQTTATPTSISTPTYVTHSDSHIAIVYKVDDANIYTYQTSCNKNKAMSVVYSKTNPYFSSEFVGNMWYGRFNDIDYYPAGSLQYLSKVAVTPVQARMNAVNQMQVFKNII